MQNDSSRQYALTIRRKFDAMGNKIVSTKKAKKLTSAELRKKKKERMARRKRGEEVRFLSIFCLVVDLMTGTHPVEGLVIAFRTTNNYLSESVMLTAITGLF